MRETVRTTPLALPWVLVAALGLVLLLVGTPATAETSIQLGEEFPLRGEETTVTVVDDSGASLAESTVTATYRPNSETATTESVGKLDASGRVTWTPTDAGIVTLSVHPAEGRGEAGATLATMDLSVRYGGFPPAGLAIMLLAGVLLFGGAALGMALLLSGPDLPADEPPST